MKLSLSQSQMLALWRRRAGLVPASTSVSIDRVDGIDADTILVDKMRQWYLALLDRAPVNMLAPEDYATHLTLVPGDGFATVNIPSHCRRLLSVRLDSWAAAATVTAPDDAVMRRQRNPYAAATQGSPIAVSADGVLTLRPYTSGDTLAEATAVVDYGDETYIIDEAALATIPSFTDNSPLSL